MKRITIGLLMACGVLSAPDPDPGPGKKRECEPGRFWTYADLSRHRDGADREGNQLPAPQRRHEDRLPRAPRSCRMRMARPKWRASRATSKSKWSSAILPEATQFGAEYLTYVLWAITPEGRTSNLGEILRNGTSGKLDVTTELQVFGLLVTAEPYFAVSRPSDVVVMENVVRPDTVGKIELIDAKYELFQRGQYEHLANVLDLKVNRKMPLELYEARNAVQIARIERRGPVCHRNVSEGRKQSEASRSIPGAQRGNEAGHHDCPAGRTDRGRFPRDRGQTPG